jgi:hypothetical protein
MTGRVSSFGGTDYQTTISPGEDSRGLREGLLT